jgi:hypothetical protein
MKANLKRAPGGRSQTESSTLSISQAFEGTYLEKLDQGQLEHVQGGTFITPALPAKFAKSTTAQGVWVREVVEDVEAY